MPKISKKVPSVEVKPSYEGDGPVPQWSILLQQHFELRRQGKAVLYERVVIISKVYHDPEFRLACGDDWLIRLNECVSDVAWKAETLVAMLKHFPHKEDWESMDMEHIRNETVNAIRKKNQQAKREKQLLEGETTEQKEPKRKGGGNATGWKEKYLQKEEEYNELFQKYERLRAEYEIVKAERDRLKGVMDTIRQMN